MTDDHPGYDALDDRRSTQLGRREFLSFVGASLAATACGEAPDDGAGSRQFASITDRTPANQPSPPRAPRLDSNPFQLGVASGDPTHESVVLWTRLVADPGGDASLPDRDIPVVWEVAPTREFDDVVANGWLRAEPTLGHSVHVDLGDLQPDTEYFYRFRVGEQWVSPTGRTQTFPSPQASPDEFRIATASCQSYLAGYYTAHDHIADEDLDALFFLGDYIYESSFGGSVRSIPHGKPSTLEEFRRHYAVYKSDDSLKKAHASCPWILTWDDHEVRNNYAGDEPSQGWLSTEDLKKLRAAAYQAYYEHLPLRVPFTARSDHMRIHRSFEVGDLVEFFVLDGRQYRSGIICDGEVEQPCDDVTDPDETMLGDEQRRWLMRSIKSSSARWNAIAQQTVFSPVNFDNSIVNPDMWDGYQHERQLLLDLFASRESGEITVLTGDIHSAGFALLPRDDDEPEGDHKVGHEIVTTSISSGNSVLGDSDELAGVVERQFDYVRHFEASKRGYTVLTYEPDRCKVEYRVVSTVEEPTAELDTDETFVIDRETGESSRIDDPA